MFLAPWMPIMRLLANGLKEARAYSEWHADPYGFKDKNDLRIIEVTWSDSEDGIRDIVSLWMNHVLPDGHFERIAKQLSALHLSLEAESFFWEFAENRRITRLTLRGPMLPNGINEILYCIEKEGVVFDERAVHGDPGFWAGFFPKSFDTRGFEDPFGFADKNGLRIRRAEWHDDSRAWGDKLRIWLSDDVTCEMNAHFPEICREYGFQAQAVTVPWSKEYPRPVTYLEITGIKHALEREEIRKIFTDLGISFQQRIEDHRRAFYGESGNQERSGALSRYPGPY